MKRAKTPVIVTENKGSEGLTFEHPSYAMVSVGRQNGGHYNLFGSSIKHNSSIYLRICKAKKKRNLSHDWYFSEVDPYIEILLSPTQWGELVSSFNNNGVPCTLNYRNGELIPECEETTVVSEFQTEFEDDLKGIAKQLTKEAFILHKGLETVYGKLGESIKESNQIEEGKDETNTD